MDRDKILAICSTVLILGSMAYLMIPPKKTRMEKLCEYLPLAYYFFFVAVGIAMLLIAIKWH